MWFIFLFVCNNWARPQSPSMREEINLANAAYPECCEWDTPLRNSSPVLYSRSISPREELEAVVDRVPDSSGEISCCLVPGIFALLLLSGLIGFFTGKRFAESSEISRSPQSCSESADSPCACGVSRQSEPFLPFLDLNSEIIVENVNVLTPAISENIAALNALLEDGKLSQCFQVKDFLGRGGFGSVFQGKQLLENNLYAIKEIEIYIDLTESLKYELIFREVRHASKLNSKYLVRYYNSWVESKPSFSVPIKEEDSDSSSEFEYNNKPYAVCYLYIQLELCRGQTLDRWMYNTVKDRRLHCLLFVQLLKGVQHIHLHSLIHRDIKPSNIFIEEDNTAKISDFGLSVVTQEDKQTPHYSSDVGSPQYSAPEQDKGDYNQKVDIFPLGLILLEMHARFGTAHEKEKVFRSLRRQRNLPEQFAGDIESKLIIWLTDPCPITRPDARTVLESEVLQEWKLLGVE